MYPARCCGSTAHRRWHTASRQRARQWSTTTAAAAPPTCCQIPSTTAIVVQTVSYASTQCPRCRPEISARVSRREFVTL